MVTARPLRAPHHTASEAALIGGGRPVAPGEIALAHQGVLFLDELPEFPLDLPRGAASAARGAHDRRVARERNYTFPADAQIVCAMNPCPCGYAGDPTHACSCAPGAVQRYRGRISGPLLDRLDVQIEVPALPYRELSGGPVGEGSAAVRARVVAARERQRRATPVKVSAATRSSAAVTRSLLPSDERTARACSRPRSPPPSVGARVFARAEGRAQHRRPRRTRPHRRRRRGGGAAVPHARPAARLSAR